MKTHTRKKLRCMIFLSLPLLYEFSQMSTLRPALLAYRQVSEVLQVFVDQSFCCLSLSWVALLRCTSFSLQCLPLWSTGSRQAGFSSWSMWAQWSDLQALEHKLSSCGAWAWLPHGMWNLPRLGIKPRSPAVGGGPSTTGPPGKSAMMLLRKKQGIRWCYRIPHSYHSCAIDQPTRPWGFLFTSSKMPSVQGGLSFMYTVSYLLIFSYLHMLSSKFLFHYTLILFCTGKVQHFKVLIDLRT